MKRGEQQVQGTVRKGPVSLKLGFDGEDYGYAIDLGLPASSASAFSRDPAIKCESVWTGETLGRSNVFAVRHGRACAFAMTADCGGRPMIAWRRSTA
jgi:predicted ATPase